ncbi:hypothetical protein ETB97_005571 [Aspergillus alliaceus]|uniref:Protein kinase domain-containing protein n=1 Tax=Petromyces alliaceus TaxID=209559 RepID=A0A8H6EA36_PETAA|nr:hypothetical protein ETB97_005571 [Aspergillus burnettii]
MYSLDPLLAPLAGLFVFLAWKLARNGSRHLSDCPTQLTSPDISPVLPDAPRTSHNSLPALSTTFDRIRECLGLSPINHTFIPRGTIDAEINEKAVRDILVEKGIVDRTRAAEVAKKTVQTARKLFTILVILKKVEHICDLLSQGVEDDDLPFLLQAENVLRTNRGQEILVPEDWDDETLEALEQKQWRVLAPVFRPHAHYEFPEKQILPFVRGESEIPVEGGYGEVFRERIHANHHDFWEPPDNKVCEVAIKKLYSSQPHLFEKERRFLETLGSAGPHPHLINLLCTYSHKGKYHLMFPCAEENLREYWNRIPLPEFNCRTLLWCLKQMTGIADGLFMIHELPLAGISPDFMLYGRHGDLKAENILWFKTRHGCADPDGILLITDLGLGKFHRFQSRSAEPATSVAFPTTYSPPMRPWEKVNRAFDIWSLGCLYLEFITWIVLGEEAIRKFAERRGQDDSDYELNTDFFYSTNRMTVRPSVGEWVAHLKRESRCTLVFHELLDLIMSHMIRIDAKERSSAQIIHRKLSAMYQRAQRDQGYLLENNQSLPQGSAPGRRAYEPQRQFRLVVDDYNPWGPNDFGLPRSRVTWPQIPSST